MATAVHIDGSLMEGGGQILRNAAALSTITGTQIHVNKIRAGRAKPGLRPQHLTGLQLVQEMSRGQLEGGAVGSCSITLSPGALQAGSYEADTFTAGSCTLMVQQALPCLLFTPSTRPPLSSSSLTLRGGTDADLAPPVDYLVHVLAPTLRRVLNLDSLKVEGRRRGFMPKGGGVVHVECNSLGPGEGLKAFSLTERGQISQVRISTFHAGKAAGHIASRLADAAEQRLAQHMGPDTSLVKSVVQETAETAVGDGCGICIVAETSTGCLLGATSPAKRGVPPEALAAQVVEELTAVIDAGACVDQWMQDQLIIFMGLAEGESSILCTELTLHTRTAISIVETLLPAAQFQVSTLRGREEGQLLWMIRCKGAGLKGRSA